jgi:hypothetical protein
LLLVHGTKRWTANPRCITGWIWIALSTSGLDDDSAILRSRHANTRLVSNTSYFVQNTLFVTATGEKYISCSVCSSEVQRLISPHDCETRDALAGMNRISTHPRIHLPNDPRAQPLACAGTLPRLRPRMCLDHFDRRCWRHSDLQCSPRARSATVYQAAVRTGGTFSRMILERGGGGLRHRQ